MKYEIWIEKGGTGWINLYFIVPENLPGKGFIKLDWYLRREVRNESNIDRIYWNLWKVAFFGVSPFFEKRVPFCRFFKFNNNNGGGTGELLLENVEKFTKRM